MKLYGSLTSPYVRKVRMFLAEKGIAYEFVNEGPSDAAGNVARLNPLGKVPLLVRDDGEVLFDSPMIVEYLDSQKGEPLIPPPGEARWLAQRWHALGQGIMDATVTRLMETRRAPERQEAAVIKKQEAKIAAALAYAASHIGDGEFLVGKGLTVADIALGAALGYLDLRYAHDWRSAHPRVASWFAEFGLRPSYRETAPA
ncbi:MAG: glutathione S-transferase N-terminal domain-containing protein [Gammaproteobacteria bacterium]|nr:glutathione S-transferase N-terminal domain-containing protein [Gammaproteobacteria bacterium]